MSNHETKPKSIQRYVCLTCCEIWVCGHKPYKDTGKCKFGCVCPSHHSPDHQFTVERVKEVLDNIQWEKGLRRFRQEIEDEMEHLQ